LGPRETASDKCRAPSLDAESTERTPERLSAHAYERDDGAFAERPDEK
jgi:hypothetical protein